MEKIEIKKLILLLSSIFPEKSMSDQGIDVYCEALRDLPDDVLKNAVKKIMVESKFFPSIAEIREKAFSIVGQISGERSAQEAWEEISRGMKVSGSYNRPEFSTALISRAVDAVGGWFHICVECDTEIMRAQFLKMYDSLLKRDQENIRTLPEIKRFIEQEQAKIAEKKNDARLLISKITEKFKP